MDTWLLVLLVAIQATALYVLLSLVRAAPTAAEQMPPTHDTLAVPDHATQATEPAPRPTHLNCSTCGESVPIWTTYADGTIACAEHRR